MKFKKIIFAIIVTVALALSFTTVYASAKTQDLLTEYGTLINNTPQNHTLSLKHSTKVTIKFIDKEYYSSSDECYRIRVLDSSKKELNNKIVKGSDISIWNDALEYSLTIPKGDNTIEVTNLLKKDSYLCYCFCTKYRYDYKASTICYGYNKCIGCYCEDCVFCKPTYEEMSYSLEVKGVRVGTVDDPAYSFSVPKSIIYIGETMTTKVKISPSNAVAQDMVWESSDVDVATIESSGQITGLQAGITHISLTVNGETVTTSVVVEEQEISHKTQTMYVRGKSATLKLVGSQGDVKWTSSNKSIATVSSNGTVKPLKVGKAVITATYDGNIYKCVVTVKNPSYSISKSKFSLYTYRTTALKVKVNTSAVKLGKAVWSSSDKSVATVSSKGVVRGVSAGTTTITIKVNGQKLTSVVKVYMLPPVTISYVGWDINFVDGVEPKIIFTNNSSKTIKYISFYTSYYNRVGDPAYSDIGGYYTKTLKVTGPIYTGYEDKYSWGAVIYNSSMGALHIGKIEIDYTDGSSRTYNYNKSWY